MSKTENPFAFPALTEDDEYNGMTLRDWFAGQAFAAALSNTTGMGGLSDAELRQQFDRLASVIYIAADAMLAAHQTRQSSVLHAATSLCTAPSVTWQGQAALMVAGTTSARTRCFSAYRPCSMSRRRVIRPSRATVSVDTRHSSTPAPPPHPQAGFRLRARRGMVAA